MVRRVDAIPDDVKITEYSGDADLLAITALSDANLSEPYSVFTYRFFVEGWPSLTLIVSWFSLSLCGSLCLCVCLCVIVCDCV